MRRWYQMIVCCSSAFPTSLVIVRSVCTATNIPNHCVPNEQCCYMLLHYVPYQYIKIHLNNSETHQASRQASPKHFAEQTRPDRYSFINKALYRTATASCTGVLRGYSGCSIHLQLPGKFFLHRSKFTTSLFGPYSASCQRMHQRWTIMCFLVQIFGVSSCSQEHHGASLCLSFVRSCEVASDEEALNTSNITHIVNTAADVCNCLRKSFSLQHERVATAHFVKVTTAFLTSFTIWPTTWRTPTLYLQHLATACQPIKLRSPVCRCW